MYSAGVQCQGKNSVRCVADGVLPLKLITIVEEHGVQWVPMFHDSAKIYAVSHTMTKRNQLPNAVHTTLGKGTPKVRDRSKKDIDINVAALNPEIEDVQRLIVNIPRDVAIRGFVHIALGKGTGRHVVMNVALESSEGYREI